MKNKYDIVKAALKLHIPEDSLKTHIKTFIGEFEETLPSFQDFVDLNNLEKIYFQFHKTKSTLKMISAVKAAKICQKACSDSIKNKKRSYSNDLIELKKEIYLIKEIVFK